MMRGKQLVVSGHSERAQFLCAGSATRAGRAFGFSLARSREQSKNRYLRMTPKPKANNTRGPGIPKLGTYRLECVLPAKVLNELIRREQETGVYRTRVAANVLCNWAENSGDAHKSSSL